VIPAPRPFARLLLIGALATAPLAAQVGHRPEESPYEDLRGRQAVTIGIGRLTPDSDPAGVGPGSGYLLTGRYDLQIATPLASIAHRARARTAPHREGPAPHGG